MSGSCAGCANSNEWAFLLDPSASPPAPMTVFAPGECAMHCAGPLPKLTCVSADGLQELVYDGFTSGAARCAAGNVGTACWHDFMADVQPGKWLLSQRNAAGEPPLLFVTNTAEPQPWIDFAATWPYTADDLKKFVCRAATPQPTAGASSSGRRAA